jgi:hypothetical protein
VRNVHQQVEVPEPAPNGNPMAEALRTLAREAMKQTAFTPAFTLVAAAEIIEILIQERDEARSELCELDANSSLQAGTPRSVAADRGWSYLFDGTEAQ